MQAQDSPKRRRKGSGSIGKENVGKPNERRVATTSVKWLIEHGIQATSPLRHRSDLLSSFKGSARERAQKAEAQAVERCERFQESVLTGTYIAPNTAPDRRSFVVVADWLQHWLDQEVKPVFARDGTRVQGLQQRTYDNYVYVMQLVLDPRFGIGHLRLASLEVTDITDFISRMRQGGRNWKPVGNSVIYKTIVVLGTALQRGYQLQTQTRLRFNPVRLVTNKKPKRTRRVLPPDMGFIRSFLASVRGDRYEFAAHLALSMGLRRSEIAALRFSDFDFLQGTLTLRGRVVRGKGITGGLGVTPGLKARDEAIEDSEELALPTGAPWAQLLAVHRTLVLQYFMLNQKTWKGLDPREPEAFLFPTEKGGPIDPGYLTSWFREKADQLEGGAGRTFHGMRHDFVNKAYDSGLDTEDVAALARHKNQNVTIQVYRHMADGHKKALFAGSADWLYADQLQDVASSD